MTEDERILQSIFGSGYTARHEQLVNEESDRRAVSNIERELLLYRERLPADHSMSLDHKPRVEHASAPVVLASVTPESDEPAWIPDELQDEIEDQFLVTAREWVNNRDVTEPFDSETMLEEAFHMDRQNLTPADRREAGKVLTQLGFRSKAVRIEGKVVRRWVRV